jgi:1-aminocyclopropane-1-carboxylate deaminase
MISLSDHIPVQSLTSFYNFHTTVDVLRLDTIDPVISGNKWYKLKEYLSDARTKNKNTLLTFGGAYSNHLIATATAASKAGLKSIGIVRGEQAMELSHTMKDAMAAGMHLYYISRQDYKDKMIPEDVFNDFGENDLYIINEGGYGIKGMEGASSILDKVDTTYTHIISAVGTGTTLAGLVNASSGEQKVIGISVMKNNLSLQNEINVLLPEEKKSHFTLFHNYHFGGYARYTGELIDFMNKLFESTRVPTDFVYTGKVFFAVQDLLREAFFPDGSKLLIIHTGGLQGNLSLSKGTLIF